MHGQGGFVVRLVRQTGTSAWATVTQRVAQRVAQLLPTSRSSTSRSEVRWLVPVSGALGHSLHPPVWLRRPWPMMASAMQRQHPVRLYAKALDAFAGGQGQVASSKPQTHRTSLRQALLRRACGRLSCSELAAAKDCTVCRERSKRTTRPPWPCWAAGTSLDSQPPAVGDRPANLAKRLVPQLSGHGVHLVIALSPPNRAFPALPHTRVPHRCELAQGIGQARFPVGGRGRPPGPAAKGQCRSGVPCRGTGGRGAHGAHAASQV